MICRKILDLKKKKNINFFIWVEGTAQCDKNSRHYSLVANISENYIFLDSCSLYYNRWPTEKFISSKNDDNLFKSSKTFVMMSFLQNDCYNCVSFYFSFVDIITNLYSKLGETQFINYLEKYFYFSYNNRFKIESNSLYVDTDGIILYLLPNEFLSLVKSEKCPRIIKRKNFKNNRAK